MKSSIILMLLFFFIIYDLIVTYLLLWAYYELRERIDLKDSLINDLNNELAKIHKK